ncbi:uncharacterized protein IUM83_06883 [Phytophthora cinnamomi]|uniref:uncharacterized protein n=1 Tax=Phytophthora cinnamomi TaxID=4785 RepID=UPI003559F2EF|nr:hypothetical protein IUM83_06883 [Phytophthora cinnamomi]
MRLGDEDVKKRIKTADTNLKKKLAWKVFSGRLSETLKVVFSGDQVLSKYKKLEREYRQGKSARRQTGNDGREDDTELCDMLNTAFARRAGVGGAILADADNVVESSDENMTFAAPESKQKIAVPMASLADAMKEGMTAITASLSSEDKLAGALHELKESQDALHELQARQLALLELLLTKISND